MPSLLPLLAAALLLATGAATATGTAFQSRLAIHEGDDGEVFVTLDGEPDGERWPTLGVPPSGPVQVAVVNHGATPHVLTIEGEPRPVACGEPVDETLAWNATTGPIAPGETAIVEFEPPAGGDFEILYRVDGGDRVGNLQPRDTLATQCANVLPVPGSAPALATGALALAALLAATARRRRGRA